MPCPQCEHLAQECEAALGQLRAAVDRWHLALERPGYPDVSELDRIETLRLEYVNARDALEQHMATHN